jgi:hypothetical protein
MEGGSYVYCSRQEDDIGGTVGVTDPRLEPTFTGKEWPNKTSSLKGRDRGRLGCGWVGKSNTSLGAAAVWRKYVEVDQREIILPILPATCPSLRPLSPTSPSAPPVAVAHLQIIPLWRGDGMPSTV